MIQNTKFVDSLVVNAQTDNIPAANYGLVLVCDFRANMIQVINKLQADVQMGYGVVGDEVDGPIIPYSADEDAQQIPFLIDPGQRIFLKSLTGADITADENIIFNFYS